MDRDTTPTKVIFRKFRDGEVIAYFPEEMSNLDPWVCLSYMHVGQHGSAILDTKSTTLATPAEYADLAAELESAGYVLDIRKRETPKMRDCRHAAVDAWTRGW